MRAAQVQGWRDNGANLYEDEAVRMLVALASFAAVIGVATPAQADPGGNDSGPDAFWPRSTRPASPITAELTPLQSAKGRAN